MEERDCLYMRTKVISSAVVAAMVILLPAIYCHHAATGSSVSAQNGTEEGAANQIPQTRAASAPEAASHANLFRNEHQAPPVQDERADVSAADHENYVIERKSELGELANTREPSALNIILGELNNPDPHIRKAALTATVDFGSRDAIPTLQNEITLTDDPQEKLDLQNAITFLELPPAMPVVATSVQ
jgi:hypothetical protein